MPVRTPVALAKDELRAAHHPLRPRGRQRARGAGALAARHAHHGAPVAYEAVEAVGARRRVGDADSLSSGLMCLTR